MYRWNPFKLKFGSYLIWNTCQNKFNPPPPIPFTNFILEIYDRKNLAIISFNPTFKYNFSFPHNYYFIP